MDLLSRQFSEVRLFIKCTAKAETARISIKVKFRETPGELCQMADLSLER